MISNAKQRSEKTKVSRTSVPFPLASYDTVYAESIQHPDRFWAKVGQLLTWSKPWKRVVDNTYEPFTKWFVGGELNACYNAVDRHVEAGKGGKVALIYDSPILGVVRKITYSELQEKVSKLGGLLQRLGVSKGDKVIIYMPLIPETIMAMLAVARIGAIHSVVFGGFAANELCTRIQHAEAKVVIAASCGIEPSRIVNYITELNEAISLSTHKPSKCIIFQRKGVEIGDLNPERDMDWEEAIKNCESAPCIPVDANDPLYILYTSGTTGEPKGITRPVGGHLCTLVYNLKILYGLTPDDVWWATSDFGWVVGHSFMCYGPLSYGMTTIIYEGKPTTTPDPSSYYRIISDYKVNGMFTVPTAMRLLKQTDPEGKYGMEYDLSSLRQLWMAGEHLDLNTKLWSERMFGAPVINHWWQTETGSGISGMCAGLKNPCTDTDLTVGLPFPGYNVKVLRKDGTEADINELGRIVIKLPLPPGTLATLYKAEDRFLKTYFAKFPGYYDTMDAGYKDKDGLLYVTARADDVINVAGHRLSTLAIENIILSHPEVAMACVISVPDPIKNEVPLCLFIMKEDSLLSEDTVSKELVYMVRENLGPVASFKLALAVSGLPVTRSGKICRKSMADLARNKLKKISATVVDPTVYKEIEEILRTHGYCREID
ncbi:acyl-CoA synthetase short-chain family member 3, mitochondrial isoform X1 [Diorhabda sublineata]|uniref:acyl-CoA synthetase short-chain family member 3, mitochondrial isoform X1 n=1 Tax=Diorhabda sublineata TaxID=1163346 RepID=UPI0024E1404F|nr:acyl-CoA synthetase short-chain family member 3, mitochondrial isoform X1 [Diorhabda sublineata]